MNKNCHFPEQMSNWGLSTCQCKSKTIKEIVPCNRSLKNPCRNHGLTLNLWSLPLPDSQGDSLLCRIWNSFLETFIFSWVLGAGLPETIGPRSRIFGATHRITHHRVPRVPHLNDQNLGYLLLIGGNILPS